jgi:fructose-bisphosphate aldolase class II
MKSLRDVLNECREKRVALGHFNISDLAGLKAIFAAAQELKLPIMIGVSEGEREFVGVKTAAALVKSLREEFDYPIYLNADHTHSVEKIEEAVRAGFDEVLFDAGKLPFDENVKETKRAVEAAKSINPNVIVEGELGWIGSSSAILENVPEGAQITETMLTTPDEAKQFVEETKVDVLAPAVGNMHGLLASMVKGETHKELNIVRIAELAGATSAFMTLHGGSGTADEGFVNAVKAGITIVHVNTEIRLAWRRGVEAGLAKDANEVTPYKILTPAVEKVGEVVKNRLKLFSGLS